MDRPTELDAFGSPVVPGLRPMTPELLDLARARRAMGMPYPQFAREHQVTLFALYAALNRP